MKDLDVIASEAKDMLDLINQLILKLPVPTSSIAESSKELAISVKSIVELADGVKGSRYHIAELAAIARDQAGSVAEQTPTVLEYVDLIARLAKDPLHLIVELAKDPIELIKYKLQKEEFRILFLGGRPSYVDDFVKSNMEAFGEMDFKRMVIITNSRKPEKYYEISKAARECGMVVTRIHPGNFSNGVQAGHTLPGPFLKYRVGDRDESARILVYGIDFDAMPADSNIGSELRRYYEDQIRVGLQITGNLDVFGFTGSDEFIRLLHKLLSPKTYGLEIPKEFIEKPFALDLDIPLIGRIIDNETAGNIRSLMRKEELSSYFNFLIYLPSRYSEVPHEEPLGEVVYGY